MKAGRTWLTMPNGSLTRDPDIIELSRNPVKVLIWGILAAILLWVVAHAATTVLIFSLAALMAYLVSPFVEALSKKNLPCIRRRIPWFLATGIVYLVLSAALILALSMLVPRTMQQVSALSSEAPRYIKKIELEFAQLRAWYSRLHITPPAQEHLKKYGKDFLEKLGATFSALAAGAAAGVLKLVSVVLIVMAGFFFSMFIVLEQDRIRQNLFDLFPEAWHKDTEALFDNVKSVVGVFLRGQILMGLIVAAGSYLVLLGLNLLGVPYAYSLLTAVLTGLLYPIPFVGFWIPRLLPPVLAFAQSGEWSAAWWVLAGLVTWGLIADNLILPFVMGKGIGISPLMILVVVFAGGELFGIWGLILSIPAAAILRLIFFYVQKHVRI